MSDKGTFEPTRTDVATTHQPYPVRSEQSRNVIDFLQEFTDQGELLVDLLSRAEYGLKKHGVLLFSHNGRNAQIDAYQERLDDVFYTAQAVMEGKLEPVHLEHSLMNANVLRKKL